jgi:hypothetical protein
MDCGTLTLVDEANHEYAGRGFVSEVETEGPREVSAA